jgi:bifunctional enzyme CysN/CysC
MDAPLTFMTLGSVDDGKSTLLGRLLYDCGAIYEDILFETTKLNKGEPDFAFLLDGLAAEREQGITIDIAWRYFATKTRAFRIADAPGHEEYTANQAAACSQAQLAICLVSANEGLKIQTRRHLALASLFGVKGIIIAISKMDKANYAKDAFEKVKNETENYARSLGLTLLATVPVVGPTGEGLTRPSPSCPWFQGPTLLSVLENFKPAALPPQPLTLSVQHILPLKGGGRLLYGDVSGTKLNLGDIITSQNNAKATISALFVAGEAAQSANPSDVVSFRLTPELDITKGQVLSHSALPQTRQFKARIFALELLNLQHNFEISIGYAKGRGSLSKIEGVYSLENLALEPSTQLLRHTIGLCEISLTTPLYASVFKNNPQHGAFLVRDRVTHNTIGVGIIEQILTSTADTPWQKLDITPLHRAKSLNQNPVTLWFTGLSGSGKSTLANMLEKRLQSLGLHTMILDGDNLRNGLNKDLGFSDEDRAENMRRVGEVAKLMNDAGIITLVSLISPTRAGREVARTSVGAGKFIEIFVDCPLETCIERDVKGLYAKAKQGNIAHFTGLQSGYEPPLNPELTLRTHERSVDDLIEKIQNHIFGRY